MSIQRISVFGLLILFSFFALTISTHATWDSVYGYDAALPAWGNAAVWGFYYYPSEGYVETSHSVGYFNLSDDDNSLLSDSSNSELQDLSDDLTNLTPRNLYRRTQI